MTLLKDKKKIISLLFYEERHIDELFVDYLERLAHFNGFAHTAHFIDLLRGTFAHLYFFNFDKKPDENAHLSEKPNAFTRCVYAIEYLTKSFPVPNEEFQLQEQEYIYYKN
ncbi:hypothetical protein [Saccharospirillum mangrovi]|uniref:hypothetical protein n=1 Tax=Saccharospirillum mangrovi TaxID=2161747 RepID=UPI000D3A85DD|nr:hypothetical protein [Saccharospirillum mangrovi]